MRHSNNTLIVRKQDSLLTDQHIARLTRGLTMVALRALHDLDAAQDAAQETIARLLHKLYADELPADYTIETYAHGILRHVIADLGRKASRFRDEDVSQVSSEQPSPLEALVEREQAERLRALIAQLPQAERDLLRRCYVDGMKAVEIAAATGEPQERLRKRKSRALDRLRALLKRGHDPTYASDNES